MAVRAAGFLAPGSFSGGPSRTCLASRFGEKRKHGCSGSSVIVPGYSGGGRVGLAPTSLLSGAERRAVVIVRTHCLSCKDSMNFELRWP